MFTTIMVVAGVVLGGMSVWALRQRRMDRTTVIDLVVITSYWQESDHPSTQVVRASHLGRFVVATLQLHHRPGINPHNGEKCAKLAKLTVRRLWKEASKVRASGPYWWSTPGLRWNDDPRGAKIYYDVTPEECGHLPEEVIWQA